LHDANTRPSRAGWIHTLGAIGAILLPLAILFSFFTSDDSGDTAAEVIAYAKDHETDVWLLQIIALTAPLLIGLFVASLRVRLRAANPAYQALTLIGGTLFIAFLGVGLTLWAAPLLSADELTNAGADAYLAFDDVGWVLLGMGGISIGAMIIAVSLAALDLGLVPKWAGWVSVLLGVISLATIVAVGIFAWAAWLIAAGLFLLLGRDRIAPAAESPAVLP
jgi:hypothetical protein